MTDEPTSFDRATLLRALAAATVENRRLQETYERPDKPMTIDKNRYENLIVGRRDGFVLFPWFAHFDTHDGPGSPIGAGKSPGAAVDDLFNLMELEI